MVHLPFLPLLSSVAKPRVNEPIKATYSYGLRPIILNLLTITEFSWDASTIARALEASPSVSMSFLPILKIIEGPPQYSTAVYPPNYNKSDNESNAVM